MTDSTIALARLLAARGMASRRAAEKLIFAGLVTVDGEVATHPAQPVRAEGQRIVVDGNVLAAPPPATYYLFYKPKGCITTRSDPQERRSIFDVLPNLPHRVEAVGRLDFDTEGALLLTNDGLLAHKLSHPSTEIPKRYVVKVWKTPSEATLNKIRNGRVYLEDGKVPPCKVRVLDGTDAGNAWVEITVTEGRNRLLRRLFAQVNHPISKLRRESFATISIRGLERGNVRPLTPDEVRRLKDMADGKKPSRAGQVQFKKGWAKAKPKAVRPNHKARQKNPTLKRR